MSINLLIRDVPDAVRDALAKRARARGQSMQTYLYEMVTADARRSDNIALLDAVRAVGGGVVDARPGETAEMLRSLRESRETGPAERAERL